MTAIGTRGDAQPYVAFAKRLIEQGHAVAFATNAPFSSFVKGLCPEVTFFPLEGDYGIIKTSPAIRNAIFEGDKMTVFQEIGKITEGCYENNLYLLWKYVQEFNSDCILTGFLQIGDCIAIGQKLNIPVVAGSTVPCYPSEETIPIGFIESPFSIKTFNKAFHLLASKLVFTVYKERINRFRTYIGVRPARNQEPDVVPHINMYSPNLLPAPTDWPKDTVFVSGYWFLPESDEYMPPEKLSNFLNAGDPPVYMGFGSMPVKSTKDMIKLFADVLQKIGKRGIFCGDASPDEEYPEHICIINEAPHQWLFPRCCMVIHHGGAGTTGAGLNAGVPTLILPVLLDQPFWAACIRHKGVGNSAIYNLKDLTPEKLEEQIRHCLSDSCVESARKFGEVLRTEDGVGNAVRFFLDYCVKNKNPGFGTNDKLIVNFVEDNKAPICQGCSKEFGLVTRRRHCRSCGKVFCAECVSLVFLPNFGAHRKPCCKECAKIRNIEIPIKLPPQKEIK
jgi:sterol 3beta-glucosyltransferase